MRPSVLAQDGYERQFAPIKDSGVLYPTSNSGFNCAFLNADPSTLCVADEDSFYTTESGVRFPVFGDDFAKNHASYIQYGGAPGLEPPLGPGE
jgi:hypothetical protein